MASIITSDIVGASVHRAHARAVSSPIGAASVRQPGRHPAEAAKEIKPSSRATGAEVETDVVHTHRAAAVDDMLASLEQVSPQYRGIRRKSQLLPDPRLDDGNRPGRGRRRGEPYKTELPRPKRIDLLA